MSLPRGTVKRLMKKALEETGKTDCVISSKAADTMSEDIANHIKTVASNAYDSMKKDGRKTILPRDFK